MNQPQEHLGTASLSTPRNRKIISIASGKGGVGKTWCAIGLSQALTELGQRALLFDGDLGLANVDIQLGLMPKVDLATVVVGDSSLRDARTACMEGGFDIIAGRSGSGSLTNLPASRLSSLRNELNEMTNEYDRIIIDMGAGIDRTVRALAALSGTCIVVVTAEPTSLTDAYAYIKIIQSKPPVPDIRILVNMAPTKEAGEKTYKTLLKVCQGFLKIAPPLLGIVRHDKIVSDCIRMQKPLLMQAPTSNPAMDIRAIAAVLV
jgi:flagellar biosynthesis protein FlhG